MGHLLFIVGSLIIFCAMLLVYYGYPILGFLVFAVGFSIVHYGDSKKNKKGK